MKGKLFYISLIAVLLFSMLTPTHIKPVSAQVSAPENNQVFVAFPQSEDITPEDLNILFEYYLSIVSPILADAKNAGELEGFTSDIQRFGVLLINPRNGLEEELNAIIQHAPFASEIKQETDQSQLSEPEKKIEVKSEQLDLSETKELSGGHFRAYLFDNKVYYYSTSYDLVTIQYELEREGTIIKSGSTSSYSPVYLNLYDSSGNPINLIPGDIIRITEDSIVNSQTIPTFIAMANPTDDILKGNSIPSANILISIYDAYNWVYKEYSTSTNSSGDFFFEVPDYDFISEMYTDIINLYLTDPTTNNEIALSYSPSIFRIYVNSSNSMVGYSGKAGETHSFLMSIFDEEDIFIRSILVDCDHKGYFYQSVGTLRSGMSIEFDYPTGEIYRYKIPDMFIEPDVVTESIAVDFLPSTDLDLSIRDLETNEWDYYEFTTNSEGTYEVSLIDFDLSSEDYGFFYHYLPDHNNIRYFFRVPYIRVDLTQSVLYATLDPEILVQVTLYSSTDQLKESRSIITSTTGYFGYSFPTMIPGDYFVVEVPNQVYTIPVSDFTFSANASTDIVSGQTFPNALVSIYISRFVGVYSYGEYFYTQTDGNGDFSIDLSQTYMYDILPGSFVELNISTGQIYKYEKSKYLPHRITIYDWSDLIYVYTTGNVPITISLENPSGTIIGSVSGTTSKYGYFSTRGLGDIAPGDTVIVSADGVIIEVLVKPLGLTEIDREFDRLIGFSSPNELLYYSVGNDDYTTITDSEGVFILDLAGIENVKGREYITIAFGNNNINQIFTTIIPYMEVDLRNNKVSGQSIPNTTLVMYLKDSLGNLKEMRQTITEASSYYYSSDGYIYYGGEGYYSVYFQSPILEDDILELHSANQVFSLKVDSVSLDMDKFSDIISGTAPANTYLYFYAYNNETSYYTYLAADESGEFFLDISNNLDLNNFSYGFIELLYPEGDLITAYKRIPGIGVNFQNSSVWGYGQPSSNTDIQLLNAASSLIATQNVNTYSEGYYYLDGFCTSENSTAVLNYNYYLKETENNITTQIPALTAYFDKLNNKIVGDGPVNKILSIYHRNWLPDFGDYNYLGYYLTTNADGSFEIPVNTIHDYDYAVIQLTDDDGNIAEFTINLVDMTSVSTAITAYPTSVTPNTIFDVSWSANSGNGKLLSTYLHYDTVSHACDHNYRYYGGWGQSSINLGTISANAAGKIYVASSVEVGGVTVWGPEVVIEIEDIEPTLVEPVSGTTSLNLPVIRGYAPAGSTVNLYDGDTLIATGISDENGYFELILSSPLSDGIHELSISLPAEDKSTIRQSIVLTVNTSLFVDPNNIYFTDRGQAMRIKDLDGLANLGGKIWIRPNSTVIATIPVTCTNPTEVKLDVEGNSISLLNSGDNHFSGSFFVGSEDVKISVSAKCDGITKTQFLANGIVDSGGYVFDTTSGNRLSGVKIIAYELNELTNTWKIWDGLTFGQPNPTYSDSDGYFRFIAPTGTYKLEVLDLGGYNPFISPEITVLDKPLQYNIELIQLPEKLYLPMITR